MMVLPVIAQIFHQVSLVSLVTNLLVLWTIPIIMIGGMLMLLVSFISQLGGQIIAWALNSFLTYFIYIVQFFGSLPFAWEYVGEFHWIVWVGYYMAVGGILIGLNNFHKTQNT